MPTALPCALLGAVVAAWLAMPAYRLAVPAGEPARRTCVRCDAPLPRWRNRCPACGGRLGRPWVLAVVGAVVAAGIGARFGAAPVLVPYLAGALLGVALGAIDLACHRLPNVLVLPGTGGAVLLLAGVALVDGTPGALVRALLGGAALFAGYLLLALLPGAGLGFGDVKLAGLLGVYLGWLGWPQVILGGLLPWLLHAPVALALLSTRRVGRRGRLPFGPAMLVAAWLVVVAPVIAAVVGH